MDTSIAVFLGIGQMCLCCNLCQCKLTFKRMMFSNLVQNLIHSNYIPLYLLPARWCGGNVYFLYRKLWVNFVKFSVHFGWFTSEIDQKVTPDKVKRGCKICLDLLLADSHWFFHATKCLFSLISKAYFAFSKNRLGMFVPIWMRFSLLQIQI